MLNELFLDMNQDELMRTNGGLVVLGVTITAAAVAKAAAVIAAAYGVGYAVGKATAHATSE